MIQITPDTTLQRRDDPAWPAAAAVLVALGVLALSQTVTLLPEPVGLGLDPRETLSRLGDGGLGALMRVTLLSQISVVLLTLLALKGFKSAPLAYLALDRPAGGVTRIVTSVGLALGLLALVNGLVIGLLRHDPTADLALFKRALAAPGWIWAVAAIVIGAPLSEEVLFRGFLLRSLAATRLGFWPAALLTNAAWTALHFQYSWVSLTEVALAGLLFTWMIRVSGSLRMPILAHAAYNGAVLALLPWLTTG